MPLFRAGVNRTRYLSFPKGVTHHFVFCPYINIPPYLITLALRLESVPVLATCKLSRYAAQQSRRSEESQEQ